MITNTIRYFVYIFQKQALVKKRKRIKRFMMLSQDETKQLRNKPRAELMHFGLTPSCG